MTSGDKLCVWTLQKLADLLASEAPVQEKMTVTAQQAESLVAMTADDAKAEHKRKMQLATN